MGLSFRVVQTDEHGCFRLAHLPVGHREVTIRAEGFLERRIPFELAVSDTEVRLVLVRGGELRARVRDGEGRPIVEAEIEVMPSDRTEEEDGDGFWERTAWELTDEQGRIAVRLPPGPYRVRVHDEGDATIAVAEAELHEGRTTSVELRAR